MINKFEIKTWLIITLVAILVLVGFFVDKYQKERTGLANEKIFVYGTLKNDLIRFYACWCLTNETNATLVGYEKIGLNVVPKSNSSVQGKIISVTSKELTRIDRYENTPDKYRRETISINGENLWVYFRNE